MAFSLVFLTIPASSQQSYDSTAGHHGMGMMHMWGMATDQQIDRALITLQNKLSLSPAQVTNIRNLAESRRTTFQSIREQARPKFEELHALLRQPNPDPAVVGTVVLQLKQIHERARGTQRDLEARLMSVLNPSQQQTVNTLRDQAQTFYALRRIGLLGAPEFRGDAMMSRLNQAGNRDSED
jgi:Spy/CpxP family protein refolding chaperone